MRLQFHSSARAGLIAERDRLVGIVRTLVQNALPAI